MERILSVKSLSHKRTREEMEVEIQRFWMNVLFGYLFFW